MKARLTITGLLLGWVAIVVLEYLSPVRPSPWLPYAVLGWFVVTALVVIRALVVAARKDFVDGTAEKTDGIAGWVNEGGAVDAEEPPASIDDKGREGP